MLGKVGTLHNIPAPSAAVLNEALKLLATFGDAKSIGTLLGQVREVQSHNEQVFREAQAAIAELKVGQEALETSQREFSARMLHESAKSDYRANELSKSEAKLNERVAKFNQEQGIAKAKLDEANESLELAERALSQRESVCSRKETDLTRFAADLDKQATELTGRSQQLEARERKLRAFLE